MSEPVQIDALEPLECERSALRKYSNDFRAICDLWFGLEWLRFYVDEFEETTRLRDIEEAGGEPTRPALIDPGPPIGSCFDWYAVSACNIVRLIGWLAQGCGATTEKPDAYMERVIPHVLVHRNKIAAHPSRIKPRGPGGVEDGLAMQEYSTMRLISQVNGRFTANALHFFRTKAGIRSSSEELIPWSIVDTHSELRKRYEPMLGKLRSSGELREFRGNHDSRLA